MKHFKINLIIIMMITIVILMLRRESLMKTKAYVLPADLTASDPRLKVPLGVLLSFV